MKIVLLNPGPVVLSDKVRAALNGPDLCHREQEFAELQSGIRQKLLDVYALDSETWAAVLLTGSGTAAMEAMLTSAVPADGKILVIANGVYGERLTRIATVHGIDHIAWHLGWGAAIDIETLGSQLREHDDITHVAVVHHETTTGRLNDLNAIGHLCQEYGANLLIDGVSSFGAEAIDFEGLAIDACAGTANKCLHGVPGTSFVIVRRDALNHDMAPRSLYLDLASYEREQSKGATPYTQSVQCFYALNAALDEFVEQGGWRARHDRYTALVEQITAGLKQLGIEPLLPEGGSSVVLNAYHLPDGISYDTLHDGLKAHGFIIYAGQGELGKTIFRISTMGEITASDIDRLIDAVQLVTQ